MGIRIENDGFSQDRLKRGFTNAQGFPINEFTVLMNWYHDTTPATQYLTYFIIARHLFDAGDEYTVAFAPNPAALGHQRFGIGSQGNDTYHASAAPVAGRWYQMAFLFYPTTGTNYNQDFYFDLPDTSLMVRRTRTAGLSGLTATHEFAFGAPPYTTNEGVDGRVASCWIFSKRLSPEYCARQLKSRQLLDPKLKPFLWAHYPLRIMQDLFDARGNRRHLTAVQDNFTMRTTVGPPLFQGAESPLFLSDVDATDTTAPAAPVGLHSEAA